MVTVVAVGVSRSVLFPVINYRPSVNHTVAEFTVGVVTTGRYSTRLLYLVFIRTKVSVTLPILVFGEGTGILAVNPLPLMVSTGVLGFVSSEPFTGIGSDYLFDAL